MRVLNNFYGGSIDYVRSPDAISVVLKLRSDPSLGFKQNFCFSIVDGAHLDHIIIENAGSATFPKGWANYEAFVSGDEINWSRAPTAFINGKLIIKHQLGRACTWYSYFPPYKDADHTILLTRCKNAVDVAVRQHSVTAHDSIELITVGSRHPHALQIWAIGRQHPGESQASWWMEGFVNALLNSNEHYTKRLLQAACVHIVPNMNPDGSRLGYYRTNSHGRNLNTSWSEACLEETPAVKLVLDEMVRTGMDFCIDVHGDEEMPFVFSGKVDQLTKRPEPVVAAYDAFVQKLASWDPAFRTDGGYVRPHTKSNPLSFCSPALSNRFVRPSITLELPFKRLQAKNGMRIEYGAGGCIHTGRSSVKALAECINTLKDLP